MGWKSIRGGRLYVDRFTRKVTTGRENTNPTSFQNVIRWLYMFTKRHFSLTAIPSPSRENHCTLGPFCAENASIWGGFSPSESSCGGLRTAF